MNKLLLILCCFLFTVSLFAQNEEEEQQENSFKSAKDLIAEAEILVNKRQYKSAKNKLTVAIKKQQNFAVAYRMLGVVNYKLQAFDEAVESYEQLFKLQADFSKAAYFECAQSYMKEMKYTKALRYFQLYKHAEDKDYKSSEQTVQIGYNILLEREINSCLYAKDIDLESVYAEAENLGNGINSPYDEYLPTLTGDGEWMIFTQDKVDENIVISRLRSDDTWSPAKSIGAVVNTGFNEGMAKFTVCGRKLYFAACNWDNGEGGCDVFEADFDDNKNFGTISNVRIAKGLNSKKWDSQPAINCVRDILFFASNREGGMGGTDIWMSILDDRGYWGPPVNMGPSVNSAGDEEAPYIAADGKTLYFSSDGRPGFGEADIFKTVWNGEQWEEAKNLGLAINTPYREAGIAIHPIENVAYFASARKGGRGGLDIYKVGLDREMAPVSRTVLLNGVVIDEETGEPMGEVDVKVGKVNESMRIIKTDENGRFFVCLEDGASYSYIVNQRGYELYVEAEFLERTADSVVHNVEIVLRKELAKKIVKEEKKNPPKRMRKNLSIYFASGQSALSDIQKEQIDKLIHHYESNKDLKIRITGFADDVGNKDFNLKLSKKRAMGVADYIQTLGLKKEQVIYEGEGIIKGNIAKHQKRKVEIKVY